MASNDQSSSSWWPKRIFTSRTSTSVSPQSSRDKPASPSSSSQKSYSPVKSQRSGRSDSIESSSTDTDGRVSIIISRVESQSSIKQDDASSTSSDKYMSHIVNRLRKGLRIDGSVSNHSDSNRQYWMPDSNAKECYECGEKFTALRRRHHCRICGQIFCSKCCNQEIDGKLIGNNSRGNVRSCNYCHKIVMSYINGGGKLAGNKTGSDSNLSLTAEYSNVNMSDMLVNQSYESEHNLDRMASRNSISFGSEEGGLLVGSPLHLSCSTFKRKSSVGFREEDYAKANTRILDNIEQRELNVMTLTQSNSPMHTFSSFNAYQTPPLKKSSDTQKSRVSEEGLHEPLWVKEIIDEEDAFSDDKAAFECSLEIIESIPSAIGGLESLDVLALNKRISSSASNYDIEMDFEKDRVSMSRSKTPESSPNRQQVNKVIEGGMNNDADGFVMASSTNWEQLKEGSYERQAFDSLNNAYDELHSRLLTQCLNDKALPLSWFTIIKSISRKVSETVSPNTRNDCDEMDIRSYVKIKTIPNGVKNDCQIVNGVVFTKNVTHRKMRQDIPKPKILLLSCPIVYQRTESKLTCLDPVLLQENEYIKNMVAKICSYDPDVILVEKTVARIAQEMLLESGITLVSNVKPIVLERISKFTGAAIVNSLDAQIGHPQLGICQRFYLQTFNQNKTLMYLDGCAPNLGCSVLLRGDTEEELKKIKHICSFMIFCDYNWRLERSFLMDEFAFPQVVSDDRLGTLKTTERENALVVQSMDNVDSITASIKVEDNSDPLRSMAAKLNAISPDIPDLDNKDLIKEPEKEQESLRDKVYRLLPSIQLNLSPHMSNSFPYLLTNEGENCKLKKFFNSQLLWSSKLKEIEHGSHRVEELKVENSETRSTSPRTQFRRNEKKHPFLTTDLKYPANSEYVKALLADFRARGPYLNSQTAGKGNKKQIVNKEDKTNKEKKLEEGMNGRIDSLDPKYHQRLSVLFSSFSGASSNAPDYCVKPWIVNMEFYGCNDIPLGGFLERYCFQSNYSCPSQLCSTPMIEHVRRFAHDKGMILIMLRQLQQTVHAAQDQIITWSWCQKCKTGTAYSTLSQDAWSLSFAKYLELKFYADGYNRRAASNSPACTQHSIHKDHFQFFAFKQTVASFKHMPIQLHEIVFPSKWILIAQDAQWRQACIEELKQISVKGFEIYSLILEKLCSIKDETIGTKYEIIVNEFMAVETKERMDFKQMIEVIQMELTSHSVELPDCTCGKEYGIKDNLVSLKRSIAKSVQDWNVKIQDFTSSKKKDEKLTGKSGSQAKHIANTCDEQQQTNQAIVTSTSASSSNEENHSDIITDTSLPHRSISMTSGNSIKSSIDDPNTSVKTLREAQQRDSQETLESLDLMKADQENCQVNENLKVEIFDKESQLSVFNYAYDIDSGINSCLGEESGIVADKETYEVLNAHDSSLMSNDSVTSTQLNDSYSPTSPNTSTTTDGNVSGKTPVTTPPSIKENGPQGQGATFSSSKIETPSSAQFTVKRIIKELLTTGNNLTIEQPFSAKEHYLLPLIKGTIPIMIDEDNPGSIISYALTSPDYEKQLIDLMRISSASPNVKRKMTTSGDLDKENAIEASTSSKTTPSAMTQHIEAQFSDNNTKFYCCVYFAEQFKKFRANILEDESGTTNGEEMFIRSLNYSTAWKARGGKSRANFYKTNNDRFIIKEMSKPELQSFLHIANYYFDYLSRAIEDSRPTLLAKIFGVYRTIFKNSSSNNSSKMYLLVMENLFYNRTIIKKFDLKGSMRNRLVDTNTPGVEEDLVLMDENLRKMVCDNPLYIRAHSKAVLNAAIDNDSLFLSSHSVMDYSLLVGIEDDNKEFVVGIIDYIRPFTWDKKVEMVIKSVGAQKLPTIISPELYRLRFCEAMNQYFLCVPDKWFSILNYGLNYVNSNVL